MRSRLLTLLLTTSLLGLSGCSHSLEQRSLKVNIQSDPPGALVYQWGKDGKTQLGRAPLAVDHAYRLQKVSFNRWWWLLPALSAGASAGGVTLLTQDDTSSSGAAFTSVGFSGLLAGLMVCLIGELLDGSETTVEDSVKFSGTMVGFSESFSDIPIHKEGGEKRDVTLTLQPLPMLRQRPATSSQTAAPAQVVAVFDIQNQTSQFDAKLLSQLNDYLVSQLSRSGQFRVVPRQQLQASMLQMKKESYRHCYDQACQIEMGRAVSAQTALVTKIMKLNPGCMLSATLYDLRAETTEAGANAKSACTLEGLMTAANQVVAQLTTK